jgi:hypothetical protein
MSAVTIARATMDAQAREKAFMRLSHEMWAVDRRA